jgi:proline racemase
VSQRDPGGRPSLRLLRGGGGAVDLSSPGGIATVDYHTAGEPFRIVTEGVLPLEGGTILEKRRFAAERLDGMRRLLVYEPRGHADMYGCFVTEPEDEGADLGVVFFHNSGFSTACGHGTIALVTWALESGRVVAEGPEARVVVDVPSGRLETVARIDGGRVRSVRFRNVPSFVAAEGLQAEGLRCNVAFGGAFYASVPSPLPVRPRAVPELIELGRALKRGLEARQEFVHPVEPELRDVYGVIFWEPVDAGPPLRQRNMTVFADGEVDRSPCGSGTSARLALLDAAGELPRGAELVHEGVVGTEFRAWVVGETPVAGRPAVLTEVEGSAFYTGRHEFTLDPDDPLAEGFLLR